MASYFKYIVSLLLIIVVSQLRSSMGAGYARGLPTVGKVNATTDSEEHAAHEKTKREPQYGMGSMSMDSAPHMGGMGHRMRRQMPHGQEMMGSPHMMMNVPHPHMMHSRGVSDKEEKKPDWIPNTKTSQYSYQVADNIHGADQFRQEKVENGVISGQYAIPVDAEGKNFRLMSYIADSNGFRITKDAIVPKDQVTGSNGANPHEAHVQIENEGGKTDYTVKESDLKKAQEKHS